MKYMMYSKDTANSLPIRFTNIVPTFSTRQYIAFISLTIAFWILTNPYTGIWHDAIIYTVQALNILYPDVYQGDVFFKYGSQAEFTLFPQLHALLIEQIGVDNSALLLTIIGQAIFFTGSISLARHFLTPGQTLLFLVILTTLPVYTNPVLLIFEVFATSRSLSVGLSLLFIAFFLKNRTIIASALLITALLLHPLMPLGVIAIALFIQRPKVVFTLISLCVVFLFIGHVLAIPPFTHLSQVIDNEWRELLENHAPFLFIELWSIADLNLLLLEFSIILSARAYCTDKLRSIFNALIIAAAACILISLAASRLSNALLIQLQTWRILLFVHIFSAIALAWLISVAWNKNCGKIVILFYCAILLSVNTIGGLPALAVHSFWVWSLKRNPDLPPLALKGAYVILAQAVFWYILKTDFTDQFGTLGTDSSLIDNVIYILRHNSFYITVMLMASLLYSKHFSKRYSTYLSIALLLVAPIALLSFDQRYKNDTWDDGNLEPYIALRKEIPEYATVYCEEGLHEGWLMLRRQHYISPYQSAGIVFFRETAIETRRRANLVFNAGYKDGVFARYGQKGREVTAPEPTLEAFDKLCWDPVLDYIVTRSTSNTKKPDKVINTSGTKFNIYYCSPKATRQLTMNRGIHQSAKSEPN